jgi:hypothetical protein
MNHPTADQSALKETQDEDGLLSSYEFVLLANGNMELMRQRFYISCFQALFDVFTLVLFSHFLGRAIKLLHKCPHSVPVWCITFQTLTGVCVGIAGVSSYMPGGFNCRTMIFILLTNIVSFSILMSTCLIFRLYYAMQIRWIVYLVIPLSLTYGALLTQALVTCKTTNDEYEGCKLILPSYLGIVRNAIDMFINLLLSLAFLKVIHNYHVRLKAKSWEKLKSDGIHYTTAIIGSNLVFTILIMCNAAGGLSNIFFTMDCK